MITIHGFDSRTDMQKLKDSIFKPFIKPEISKVIEVPKAAEVKKKKKKYQGMVQ